MRTVLSQRVLIVLATTATLSGCTSNSAVNNDADAKVRPDAGSDATSAIDASPDVGVDGGGDAATSGCTSAYDTNSNARELYWGTLHEHTAWSLDAYFAGTTTFTPEEAYQFAQGKTSRSLGGKTLQHTSATKLDWVAITDHSEFFETQYACIFNDDQKPTSAYNSKYCTEGLPGGPSGGYQKVGFYRQAQLAPTERGSGDEAVPNHAALCKESPNESTVNGAYDCEGFQKTLWEKAKTLADKYNDTQNCSFATLQAYEYSSNAEVIPGKNKIYNMHRNVIFRSSETTSTPLDFISYPTVDQMWSALDAECVAGSESATSSKKCNAISIPHNPNDSAGNKWNMSSDSVNKLRSRFETLVEIHQHKGSSECLNSQKDGKDGENGYDSWCEFELATTTTGATDAKNAAGDPICYDEVDAGTRTGDPCRKADKAGYVREGLGKGLVEYSKQTGNAKYNPLKLGITASTDSHNGTPGYTIEENWAGHTGITDSTAAGRTAVSTVAGPNTLRLNNPGGITAVWAKHRKREDIYDALAAREAYGTSGTKIAVYFFQVWDDKDWCGAFDAAALRASGAVPMGSNLVPSTDATKKPRFVVYAKKDARFTATSGDESHNIYELDLVQTLVENGAAVDHVFKVKSSTSGGESTMCKVFSATDVATDGKTLAYTSTTPSLWYARVLETASFSWRKYDCDALKGTANACATDITGTNYDYNTALGKINERAWTSPIWLLP